MDPSSWTRNQVRTGWKRFERARAIAQLPFALFGFSAQSVAQQANLIPVQTPTEIRQDRTREGQEQFAREDSKRLKAESGRLVHEPQPERPMDSTKSRALPDRANLGRGRSERGSTPRDRERKSH